MAVKVIFLSTTGAGTWTVPADWTSTNKVECIGGGGGGYIAVAGGGGGGGGAYSSVSNIATLSPAQVVNIAVGAGGTSSTAGGDTWFGATTLASSLVGAKGGSGSTAALAAPGGQSSGGFPTSGGVRNSGGAGGNGSAAVLTGGGGGGAAGPGGAGGLAGNGDATATGADFGGGGGSGAGSTTAGGAGGAGTTTAGAGGTNATGGGPGAAGGSGNGLTASGSASPIWSATHQADGTTTSNATASPGGGGGGGGSATNGFAGGGALYGGGGGGRGVGTGPPDSTGAQGIIVVTYTTAGAGAANVTGAQTLSATTQTSSITVPADAANVTGSQTTLAATQSATVTSGLALFMRPSSDASTGGWTNEAGGTALFASLDEASASDSDYIQSGLAPAADVAEVHLSDPTGALASATLRFRIGKAVNDATVINIMAALVQGAMVIASWTYADVAFGYTLKTETLTAPQLAAITNANDLRIRFTADSPSGVSAEFQQFLDRAGTIAEPYYTAYGNLIDGIVAAGAWADIEALGVFAAPNETTALINVKAAGTFTKVTAIGAGMVFTAGEGFSNADVSNYGAISTGVIPASASLYSRNSAHIGIYKSGAGVINNDVHGWLNAAATVGGYVSFNQGTAKRCNIHSNFSTDDLIVSLPLVAPAHLVGNRSGASASELYARGALVASDSIASLDISDGTFPIWIGARNFNGNANQPAGGTYSHFHVGRSLSGTKVAALNTLIEAFLAAVP